MNSVTHPAHPWSPQMPANTSPQTPDAEPYTTGGKSKEPNASTEDQLERFPDPQLPESSYRVISTVHSAIMLGYIIAGNCLCSGFICLCLWGFSTIKDLAPWQKRGFNAVSLLLSGVLGFGIGFLLDRIGLLARGTILQSKSHSVKEVCPSLEVSQYVRVG